MTQYRTLCRCEWRWYTERPDGSWEPIGVRPDCEWCLGSGRVPPPWWARLRWRIAQWCFRHLPN